MSLPIIESNTSKSDLNQVSASFTPISKKISLGKALAIAILAIAVIALLYLEVKYRLVSIGISYVIANPWVMGLIGVVAILGIAYLIYRNMKSSSTNTTSMSRESGGIIPSSPTGLIEPATEEELGAALRADATLKDRFRYHFDWIIGEDRESRFHAPITSICTVDEARWKVNVICRHYELQPPINCLSPHPIDIPGFVRRTDNHTEEQRYESESFYAYRSLAVRWLMSPYCLERT